jgi:hypothetical protein
MPVSKGHGPENGLVDRMGQLEGLDVDRLQGIARRFMMPGRHDDGILHFVAVGL